MWKGADSINPQKSKLYVAYLRISWLVLITFYFAKVSFEMKYGKGQLRRNISFSYWVHW